MFAGKSTLLIDRLREAAAEGLTVLAVKSALDDRYHANAIATHNGGLLDAQTIGSPADLADLVRSERPDVVGLDEAHFYEEGLFEVVSAIVASGIRVILAGLDRTSLNEPFGEMARLLIEADEVVKLAGSCAVCRRPAVHTVRLFDSTESIVVGGVGMFENRCRLHLRTDRPQTGPSDRQPDRQS